MKHIYASLLLALGATTISAADIQQANIFHAFNWKFTDIEAEIDRIAEAGYGAVQVSPVQGNCRVDALWADAYMPYDFAMDATKPDRYNGNGTRDELKSLCEAARAKGISIIVDVVANHINKTNTRHAGFWHNQNGHVRSNGYVNYNNRNSIVTGQLGDYPDIISEDPAVIERACAFVKDLKSLGVEGIRWDAAKHIGLPSEGCDFWKEVTAASDMYNYGEILDNPAGGMAGNNWTLLREYAGYMSVTDNMYCADNLASFASGVLPQATGGHILSPRSISPERVVLWGESHDTYSNKNGASKTKQQDAVDRAYVFVACRDKETALYFSRPEATSYDKIRMGVKGSVNGLENPVVTTVNAFRKAMSGRPDCVSINRTAGVASVTRQNGGAVIIRPKAGEARVDATNGNAYLPAGSYRDIISGNTFTVTPSTISGTTGPTGIAVLAVEGTMGIDGISADTAIDADTPVEYYNLQGIRVDNPSGGIFIRRAGSKTDKVIL